MKKFTLTLIALVTLVSIQVKAGDPPSKGKDGILQKGNIIIDAYYGFPNLWTTVLKAAYLPGDETSSSWGSSGPFGIKAEYMISNKMGIGLDINYASSWVQWTETGNVYNASTGLYTDGTYKVTVPRVGIMPRFYYHFLNHKHFEMYGSAAIGYKSTAFKYTSNDPTWAENDMSVIPLGYRMALGGRLFFTDNIGLNFEFGIGGALLTAGLAVKI
jgi:hypothetical protein